MFGYITVNKKDLSEDELKLYREYYCGVCRALRQEYGLAGKLTLRYDMAFLALLLADLYDQEGGTVYSRCLQQLYRRVGQTENPFTAYAADMTVILSYYQCLDHWRDEKALGYKAAAKALESGAKKAGERWPRQYQAVAEGVERLTQVEQRGLGQTDQEQLAALEEAAAGTGTMLAEIFAVEEDAWAPTLRGFGFYLGKFIYLMDAYEDVDKDIRRRRYNPLIPLRDREDFDGYCRELLTGLMGQAAAYFERLPVVEFAGLLRNIIYSGVWNRYELTRSRRNKKEKR